VYWKWAVSMQLLNLHEALPQVKINGVWQAAACHAYCVGHGLTKVETIFKMQSKSLRGAAAVCAQVILYEAWPALVQYSR
jgi:hypothetical protein